MNLFRRLRAWFAPPPPPPAPIPVPEPLTPHPLKISGAAIDALRSHDRRISPFLGLPKPPPGVRPANDGIKPGMAMDDIGGAPGGAWGAWATAGLWGEGLAFPGYPYLAELAQRPEYRNIVETLAEEMTRKWIKIISTGDDDKTDEAKLIETAQTRFGLRAAFNRAMELDGFFGMGMIYIDVKGADSPEEMAAPLIVDKGKIGKGGLLGFIPVDPTWVSPSFYNSTNPLAADFMVPSTWYVMGKMVHASRLLIFRSREVPDILKAAYNFGGVSQSQIAKPYVDNWLRTRQSVSDLLHAFTVFVLKTNLGALLQDASAMTARLLAFVLGRDNKGLMLVDKETEELDNVSAPLGGLDHLQAQALEQLAVVSQQPLIKLTGITPSGLNSGTEDEIHVWYDRVRAKQEKVFTPNLTTALNLIQLNETGAIDPEIGFEFVPLWELDAAGKATVQKMQADTDAVQITNGVIAPEEARTRLAADPESPYHGLEGPPPELPDDVGGDPDGDPAEKIGAAGANNRETGANAEDAAFEEEDHPRDPAGKFATHGNSTAPHPLITASGTIKSHQDIEKFLSDHGVPYRLEASKSDSEAHGPSASRYFHIDHPTDPVKMRLSDHNYLPAEIDLPYGIPAHKAEGIIAKRLGLPMSPEALEFIRTREKESADFEAKRKAEVARKDAERAREQTNRIGPSRAEQERIDKEVAAYKARKAAREAARKVARNAAE